MKFYHCMCNLQTAYELKNGKVDNQENILLDPFVFRWDKRVEHDDMDSVTIHIYFQSLEEQLPG